MLMLKISRPRARWGSYGIDQSPGERGIGSIERFMYIWHAGREDEEGWSAADGRGQEI